MAAKHILILSLCLLGIGVVSAASITAYLSTVTLILSRWFITSAIVQVGSTQTVTANIIESTGTSYTYNILIYAPNGMLMFNSLSTTTATSNTFTFQQTLPTGEWTANIIVSNSTTTVNSSFFYNVTMTNVTCVNSIFSFLPLSGYYYNNVDTGNFMVWYATANSPGTTNVIVDTLYPSSLNPVVWSTKTITQTIYPPNVAIAFLPYNSAISYSFQSEPSVVLQCIPNPAATITVPSPGALIIPNPEGGNPLVISQPFTGNLTVSSPIGGSLVVSTPGGNVISISNPTSPATNTIAVTTPVGTGVIISTPS